MFSLKMHLLKIYLSKPNKNLFHDNFLAEAFEKNKIALFFKEIIKIFKKLFSLLLASL